MKKAALFLSLIVLLSACKDKFYNKYVANVPVYMDFETFRLSGNFEGPKSITEKGNIYIKDQYLFIVDPNEGIHFIDNSNPASPSQIGFLNLIGTSGMAIKDNYLYVNSLIDLVVFDISNIFAPVEVARLEDQFPNALPVTDVNYPFTEIDKSKGVVVAWETKEVKEEVSSNNPTWVGCTNCDFSVLPSKNMATMESFALSSDGGGSAVGISGSISLFTILNDHLYIMDNYSILSPISIADPTNPIAHEKIATWGEVETLFPYKDHIFMGTPSGILIYNTINPNVPEYVSALSHARGCDPVVVQDDIAYVTVRSGGPCGGDINQLDVIDVSNLSTPILNASFQMDNPHGLGIDGNQLFICDGDAGLKVFDASNPLDAGNNLIAKFKNIQATDVIPFGDVAILIGDDGIYQYDYADVNDIKLLSKIKF